MSISGMDRAYEGGETRQLVLELGFTPVVPPKQGRAAVHICVQGRPSRIIS